ncbi:Monogalactosyldiacylglycerol synthase [Deinococcus proteolyticus MRP]|uniref:Monogalactosyldiacylglycerol synthase n=2 Tax=Deinococcus proteolyticus TaxID=55148 RepID=F0RKL7_DEIPM|nr:Monogalactosyldiacylglycerol synthase [Deinococcus proteolyticus MRP]
MSGAERRGEEVPPEARPPSSALHSALMISASFGGGHHQASSAVAQALAERVRLRLAQVDAVEMLTPAERALIVGVYGFWLRHLPAAYHAFYRWTDQPSEPRIVTSSFEWLGIGGLRRELLAQRPELVVSTFPTSVALADTVRRREGLHFLNALVLTDYRVHHHWARPQADLLLLPTESTRREMLGWGMAPERLAVTGLPVSLEVERLSRLGRLERRREMLAALGWDEDPPEPLILLSGGSGVYGAFMEILEVLGNLGERVRVLVVAGPCPPGVQQLGGAAVHHLGYRADFAALLAGVDLLVGKAGGMTVAETTALGVPLVVYRPIPGQEEHNAEYLLEHGAALWPRSPHELRRAVLTLLDPQARARTAAAARALGCPDAARQVAGELLTRLGWEA